MRRVLGGLGLAVGTLSGCAADNPFFEVRPGSGPDTTLEVTTETVLPTSTTADVTTDPSSTGPETPTQTITSEDSAPGSVCGNGIVEGDEECDEGSNNHNESACLEDCKMATCGDGHVHFGVEPCDDGNDNPGDGCHECMFENCGDGKIDDGEWCDPTAEPYKSWPLLEGLCTTNCTLNTCAVIVNTQFHDFPIGFNQWLDTCATTPGDRVLIALVNEQFAPVYVAEAPKPHAWSPDNLTRGAATPEQEFERDNHTALLKLEQVFPQSPVPQQLMITSRIADPGIDLQDPATCHRDLGNGYGLAVYAAETPSQAPILMVMGAYGWVSNSPRQLAGFNEATEIAYNGGQPMHVCNEPGVKGFRGFFLMSVLP